MHARALLSLAAALVLALALGASNCAEVGESEAKQPAAERADVLSALSEPKNQAKLAALLKLKDARPAEAAALEAKTTSRSADSAAAAGPPKEAAKSGGTIARAAGTSQLEPSQLAEIVAAGGASVSPNASGIRMPPDAFHPVRRPPAQAPSSSSLSSPSSGFNFGVQTRMGVGADLGQATSNKFMQQLVTMIVPSVMSELQAQLKAQAGLQSQAKSQAQTQLKSRSPSTEYQAESQLQAQSQAQAKQRPSGSHGPEFQSQAQSELQASRSAAAAELGGQTHGNAHSQLRLRPAGWGHRVQSELQSQAQLQAELARVAPHSLLDGKAALESQLGGQLKSSGAPKSLHAQPDVHAQAQAQAQSQAQAQLAARLSGGSHQSEAQAQASSSGGPNAQRGLAEQQAASNSSGGAGLSHSRHAALGGKGQLGSSYFVIEQPGQTQLESPKLKPKPTRVPQQLDGQSAKVIEQLTLLIAPIVLGALDKNLLACAHGPHGAYRGPLRFQSDMNGALSLGGGSLGSSASLAHSGLGDFRVHGALSANPGELVDNVMRSVGAAENSARAAVTGAVGAVENSARAAVTGAVGAMENSARVVENTARGAVACALDGLSKSVSSARAAHEPTFPSDEQQQQQQQQHALRNKAQASRAAAPKAEDAADSAELVLKVAAGLSKLFEKDFFEGRQPSAGAGAKKQPDEQPSVPKEEKIGEEPPPPPPPQQQQQQQQSYASRPGAAAAPPAAATSGGY